jgi:outer membrane cobalamin receptor
MRRLLAAAAVSVLLARNVAAQETHHRHATPHRITHEEIERSQAANVEQLLRRYRPALLLSRRVGSRGDGAEVTPNVYVDGRRAGGVEILHLVPLSNVLEIRYLDASQARSVFYERNPGGVISIQTRRGDDRWSSRIH